MVSSLPFDVRTHTETETKREMDKDVGSPQISTLKENKSYMMPRQSRVRTLSNFLFFFFLFLFTLQLASYFHNLFNTYTDRHVPELSKISKCFETKKYTAL